MKPTKPMAIPEVLLVQNPYNGKHINILPLMELMNRSEVVADDGPGDVSAMILHATDFFTTMVRFARGADHEATLESYQEAIYFLQLVRKGFDQTKELR